MTARLTIEPLAHDHADGLVAALADERVGAFTSVAPTSPPSTPSTNGSTGWRRVPGPTGRPSTGTTGWPVEPTTARSSAGLEATSYGPTRTTCEWAEVAYVFGPAHWGHGYAAEGVQWMLDHLRDELGVDECWAAIHPDNERSVRLVERLGFERRTEPGRPLGSYDEPDLVFVRFAAPA